MREAELLLLRALEGRRLKLDEELHRLMNYPATRTSNAARAPEKMLAVLGKK
jgi:hypothetical protein